MTVQSQLVSAAPAIRRWRTDRLSHYRTEHEFEHYAEFTSPEEYAALVAWARERRLPVLILGAGSNVLFVRRRVRALVLKNRLPRVLREIDARTLEVSSSVMLAEVLKWCESRDLDSFYYLASVPATLGGAIAMNAGRGRARQRSIFDYVQSVSLWRDGRTVTQPRAAIPVGYRQTPFTGPQEQLILSVVLSFPPAELAGSPRRERVAWSKEHQDHSAPNCGSVFRQFDPRVLTRLRGRRFFTAAYSGKTTNWILNTGGRSWPIVWLIRLTQLLHLLVGRRAEPEVIRVR